MIVDILRGISVALWAASVAVAAEVLRLYYIAYRQTRARGLLPAHVSLIASSYLILGANALAASLWGAGSDLPIYATVNIIGFGLGLAALLVIRRYERIGRPETGPPERRQSGRRRSDRAVALLPAYIAVVVTALVATTLFTTERATRKIAQESRARAELSQRVNAATVRLLNARSEQGKVVRLNSRRMCVRVNHAEGVLAGLVRQAVGLLRDPRYAGITEGQRRALLHAYRQSLHELRPVDCVRAFPTVLR